MDQIVWTVLISLASLLVNGLALMIVVRRHCRDDDRKFGALVESVARLEKREDER